jgi:hypothetical protein
MPPPPRRPAPQRLWRPRRPSSSVAPAASAPLPPRRSLPDGVDPGDDRVRGVALDAALVKPGRPARQCAGMTVREQDGAPAGRWRRCPSAGTWNSISVPVVGLLVTVVMPPRSRMRRRIGWTAPCARPARRRGDEEATAHACPDARGGAQLQCPRRPRPPAPPGRPPGAPSGPAAPAALAPPPSGAPAPGGLRRPGAPSGLGALAALAAPSLRRPRRPCRPRRSLPDGVDPAMTASGEPLSMRRW